MGSTPSPSIPLRREGRLLNPVILVAKFHDEIRGETRLGEHYARNCSQPSLLAHARNLSAVYTRARRRAGRKKGKIRRGRKNPQNVFHSWLRSSLAALSRMFDVFRVSSDVSTCTVPRAKDESTGSTLCCNPYFLLVRASPGIARYLAHLQPFLQAPTSCYTPWPGLWSRINALYLNMNERSTITMSCAKSACIVRPVAIQRCRCFRYVTNRNLYTRQSAALSGR